MVMPTSTSVAQRMTCVAISMIYKDEQRADMLHAADISQSRNKDGIYFSCHETGITACFGSGGGRSPLASRQRMALRVAVSAASATEKSNAEDSLAPGAFLALA